MKIVKFVALKLALLSFCCGPIGLQAQDASPSSKATVGKSFSALIGSVMPEKQQVAYCTYYQEADSATVINLGDTAPQSAPAAQTQTNLEMPNSTPAPPPTALPANGLNSVLGAPKTQPISKGMAAQPAPVSPRAVGPQTVPYQNAPSNHSGQVYSPVVVPIVSGSTCDGSVVGCDSGSCVSTNLGPFSGGTVQCGLGDCGTGCGCDGRGSYFPGSSLFKGTLLGLFRDSLSIDRGRRTLSLFGGLNWLVDSPNSSLFNATSNLDDEYLVGGAIGRRISQRVRTDFEYTYRRNEGPLNGSTQVIDTEVSSFLINGYLYSRRCFRNIRPYVGAGLGMAYVDFQEGLPGQTPSRFATSNTNFAWQGIGGLETQFGRAAFFAEYRFFTTGQIEFTDTTTNNVGEGNYFAHNVLFGLRINF